MAGEFPNSITGKRSEQDRIFTRKKDGQRYWCDPSKTTHHALFGLSVRLSPQWDGRTHYKSLTAFKAQFVNDDGSAIE